MDHFIPWSKYPHDLGHNFVLACTPCNRSKRDLLADHRHRERWLRRNQDKGAQMSAEFQDLRLPHDLTGSLTVAAWAYSQADAAGAHLWSAG
ncbi:MAG: hypothetical protein IPM94_07980 [bacterium]|nr:hypothetical protein [bacterium]